MTRSTFYRLARGVLVRPAVSLLGFALIVVASNAAASVVTTNDGQGADAYVRGDIHADTNFGAETFLGAKDESSNLEFSTKSYVRFDLVGTSGPIVDAILTFEIGFISPNGFNPDSPHTVSIHGLNDGASGENWDESTITWNNAPANVTSSGSALTADATLLGSITIPNTAQIGDALSFNDPDLLNFVLADSNDLVTLILTDATVIVTGAGFATKESTVANAPRLELLTRSTVPEPATLSLLFLGIAGLVAGIRRR